MRRAGGLWNEVRSFERLAQAARRASRGKRRQAAVARFLERVEPETLALQRELDAGTWRPGHASRFEIHDPKRRVITVVPFRDRVVHHAVMAPLEPVFERRMIASSYACRRGKGTHAALRHARKLLCRHRYFLKLDVAAFFPSLEHEVVRETLGRIVKDRRVLELLDRILAGPEEASEDPRGLPIGSLTSQWLANLVLDRLDHQVKEVLRIRGYVRYMDDIALFANEKTALWDAHAAIDAFLSNDLRLALKTKATQLAPAGEGLPYLGWRLHRGTVRVRPENLRRYRWRLRLRRWEWRQGRWPADRYRQAVASLYAHVAHGSTLALRQRWSELDGAEL